MKEKVLRTKGAALSGLPAPSMSTQARDGEQPRDAASKTVDARLRGMMGTLAVWHSLLDAIEADGSAERFGLDGHEHFLVASDAMRLCEAIRRTAAEAVEARARLEPLLEERMERVGAAAAARKRGFRKTHKLARNAIAELYASEHVETMVAANDRFPEAADRVAVAPAGVSAPREADPSGGQGDG